MIHGLNTDRQRDECFAFYRASSNADQMTMQKTKRGDFRLHLIGRPGISEDCITPVHQDGFDQLRRTLPAVSKVFIPGTVTVR